MNKNLGKLDRGLRVTLGVAIIAYGVVESTWLGAIGLVPILTALIGWCPAYVPFNVTTCSKNECSVK